MNTQEQPQFIELVSKPKNKVELLDTNSESADFQSIKSNLTPLLLSTYSNILLFIYDRGITGITTTYSPIPEEVSEELAENGYSRLPLFFGNPGVIKVPTKVQTILERYTPVELLKQIHPDTQTAIEMCLLFLTNLNSTYFEWLEDEKKEGWKELKATTLKKQLNFEFSTYKRVIEALMYKTKQGAILERDSYYITGLKCYNYRLATGYFAKGLVTYHLKTAFVKQLIMRRYYKLLQEGSTNAICRNLLGIYGDVTLPTKEEILKEGKRLVKLGYKTKKGKKLTLLNKHPITYFKDAKERSFVERDIKKYEYLVLQNGLMIPTVGDERSGGRIVDSFTLMPSWIRNLVKVNGQPIVEADYSALHPNIAANLYGGKTEFITHAKVAEESGIEIKEVKLEHLSFFNKTWNQMKESPLYNYYWSKEPVMMSAIMTDKFNNYLNENEKHKITSRKMFKKEVEIMNEVVTKLNSENIHVGYIYDALFCTAQQVDKVKEVMNQVVINHGVKTVAK